MSTRKKSCYAALLPRPSGVQAADVQAPKFLLDKGQLAKDRWTHVWTDGHLYGQMDIYMDRWMDRWTQ